MNFFEEPLSSKIVFRGRIVSVRDDMARLQNGKEAHREVVEHPGGVAIVPLLHDNSVLMVRQYRFCMSEELLEIPAGKLEYGEDPLECAIRELSEETGCRAEKMIYFGPIYPSPGFSQEILHIYLATGLVRGEMHPDEDEFLSVETIALEALIAQIMAGAIKDAKTIIGLMKTKQYFEQLF
ncbi:NUDIX hydrolase [Oscillospiraceae bacterium WX1]